MTQVAAVPYDPATELELLRAENERLTRYNRVMRALIDRRRLDAESVSDEQLVWMLTMRLEALRTEAADANERAAIAREGRESAIQEAKDGLRKEMAELRKRIGDREAALGRNVHLRRGLMRGIRNLCRKRRADVKRLREGLHMAVLIIRHEARSPIWDHSPDTREQLLRWCREIYEEAGEKDPEA